MSRCEYSGLGLIDDGLPKARDFGARCSCGAVVTVVNGRIPMHDVGVDERPHSRCLCGTTDNRHPRFCNADFTDGRNP